MRNPGALRSELSHNALPIEPTATKSLLRERSMDFHVAQCPANALP